MPFSLLRFVAALTALVHLLGLAAAALWLEPGTAAHPLADRMAYVATATTRWRLAWAVWVGCGVSLLVTMVLLRRATRAGKMVLFLSVAALGMDLFCDWLQIVALPSLAAAGDAEGFVRVERLANLGGQIGANGLYSLAVLWLSREARLYLGAGPVRLGVGVACAGGLMVVAGLVGSPPLLAASTALVVFTFSAWVVWAAARA